ncbi:hypothetical protein E2C01_056305 [Portunus trituberculatus]|uniref:Uncharacterized protein n=1 Tax=Portunus trituberculatus TaxID=210409 RepID=A0A5B7GX08_PORTR|nr:hypothetical protein [Portunus trituberculatus]
MKISGPRKIFTCNNTKLSLISWCGQEKLTTWSVCRASGGQTTLPNQHFVNRRELRITAFEKFLRALPSSSSPTSRLPPLRRLASPGSAGDRGRGGD